ncbi:hypothetical protein ACIBG8_09720 [Nonomuraea sp. NPDC050556]|uniref:hypothetical protein n=1 Tax=Nonomuraea sp. NPDC050556 TaxID=3364369 RepID=UPI0037A841DD
MTTTVDLSHYAGGRALLIFPFGADLAPAIEACQRSGLTIAGGNLGQCAQSTTCLPMIARHGHVDVVLTSSDLERLLRAMQTYAGDPAAPILVVS